MSVFFTWAGSHLQAIIYGVASSLLYPVLAVEVVSLVLVAFEVGRFTLESFGRLGSRRRFNLHHAAASLESSPDAEHLFSVLDRFPTRPALSRARTSLGAGSDLSRTRILKALADAEIEVSRRLEKTRILVRVGPILGLMGTLIPISPALVGLAQGDIDTLANNLVIAFSATVCGLLIGGLSYLMTTVRDRYYQQDIVDLEYLFDHVEE